MAKSRPSKSPSKFVIFFLVLVMTASVIGLVAAFSTFNGNLTSKASVLSEAVAQYSVSEAAGVANQDGKTMTVGSEKSWIGTGESTKDSYLGLLFTGANIPANATVKSAKLELTAVGGWITTGFDIFGDTSIQGVFTSNNKLSTHTKTAAKLSVDENVKWEANQTYSFDVTAPVTELVGSNGKSMIGLILKGNGPKYGRKEFFGAPSTGKAPKLTVVYTAMVAGTPAPRSVPSVSPVSTPVGNPSVAPSVMPSMPGMSMTPTPTSGGTGGSVVGSNGHEDSPEMNYWSATGKNKPNPKYDKCDDGTDIVAAHKTFTVIGPDGKNYPTWHAPVVTNPITGVGKCYFGHEHGRDPKGYAYYDEVRKNFAFDANKNGTIDANELAVAGIPFGYVNNQVDSYYANNPSNTMFMRHEDHVGHKVEYANGEGDTGTGAPTFNKNMTGGLIVPYKTANNTWDNSGVSCYHFDKIHQGVSSPDALSNNMHEIIIHEKCTSTRQGTPDSTTLLSGMMTFGAPGEFTQFCNDNRTDVIQVGKNADTMNLPGTRGDGTRNIITRGCIERTVLVKEGQWSSFPYEEWDGTLRVVKANGTEIAASNGSWEVLDAIRYYNPASPTMISYTADTCYETLPDGRRTRGGTCDAMTNYGAIKGITWDDRRSAYQGRVRGQYVNYHRINNAGGPTVWYTDPFGRNASPNYFPGSIKQVVSSVNLPQFSSDPRIVQRENDDGNGTVHAPN